MGLTGLMFMPCRSSTQSFFSPKIPPDVPSLEEVDRGKMLARFPSQCCVSLLLPLHLSHLRTCTVITATKKKNISRNQQSWLQKKIEEPIKSPKSHLDIKISCMLLWKPSRLLVLNHPFAATAIIRYLTRTSSQRHSFKDVLISFYICHT